MFGRKKGRGGIMKRKLAKIKMKKLPDWIRFARAHDYFCGWGKNVREKEK